MVETVRNPLGLDEVEERKSCIENAMHKQRIGRKSIQKTKLKSWCLSFVELYCSGGKRLVHAFGGVSDLDAFCGKSVARDGSAGVIVVQTSMRQRCQTMVEAREE